MKKVKRAGSVFVCLIAFSMMVMSVAAYGEEDNPDKVLATVGEEKITEADLYAKTSMLPPQFRARYETPEGKKKLLDQTVKFSLLSQEARKLGIDKRKDVANKIKEIVDNIIIQELTKQEISEKIKITDEEIKKYYKENKDSFTKPEKVKANLILFEVKDDATAEEKTEKEKKAEEVLKQLKNGADFEKLAKELSEDKRTKKRGGSTGFFSKGKRLNTYGEKFEEIVFSLKPGETSDVFESKKGFYIVRVADKKARRDQSLDEVKNKIERRIKQEKQKEAYSNFIEELKKKYPVKMY